jgi:hypothetical protein
MEMLPMHLLLVLLVENKEPIVQEPTSKKTMVLMPLSLVLLEESRKLIVREPIHEHQFTREKTPER